jgi:hypothetical protein
MKLPSLPSKAVQNPRTVNMDLVNAQQARVYWTGSWVLRYRRYFGVR